MARRPNKNISTQDRKRVRALSDDQLGNVLSNVLNSLRRAQEREDDDAVSLAYERLRFVELEAKRRGLDFLDD